MTSKECELQLNQLIIDWDEDRATRLNATNIEAIKHLMIENQIQQDTIKTQKLVIGNLSERIEKAVEKINFYETTEWGLKSYEILELFREILKGDRE